jgi:hypothetical protein
MGLQAGIQNAMTQVISLLANVVNNLNGHNLHNDHNPNDQGEILQANQSILKPKRRPE